MISVRIFMGFRVIWRGLVCLVTAIADDDVDGECLVSSTNCLFLSFFHSMMSVAKLVIYKLVIF